MLEHLFRTKPLAVIEAEEQAQDIPRSLGLFDLLMIGIGGTVGAGIFATTGGLIADDAGPAAVISWVIGGFVCVLNGLAYMELTTRVPSSGSTYAYAYHAIGELPAVVAGWLLTLEYAVSGAGVARSWADKVVSWGGSSIAWMNYEHSSLLGFGIQALSVVVLLMGVSFGKLFVNSVTMTKCSVVAFIIVFGFIWMTPSNLDPFIPPRANGHYGVQGIITASSKAFFGYIGFDEVCCLAAEAKNPRKVMPLAVIGVVLGTMILSVLASFALAGMIKYSDFNSKTNPLDFSAGFEGAGHKWAGTVVHFGEILTMPVVVLVAFLAQPRLNYALACDGLAPKLFSVVDAKGNLFWNTLVTGIFFSFVALIVPFATLWDMVSFGILVSFIMSNVSLLMIRTRDNSPQLAPKLIGLEVLFSCIAAACYQFGYANNSQDLCLYVAIVCVVITGVLMVLIMVKCPLGAADDKYFMCPMVPLIPCMSILFNWYLICQLSYQGMLYCLVWVVLAILSYFFYGFHHSSGRNGWTSLMNFIPDGENGSTRPSMPSVNEVRPSMSSMMRTKSEKLSLTPASKVPMIDLSEH